MDNLTSRLSYLPLASFADRFNLDRLRSESSSLQSRLSNVKSLTDFFDIKRISKPQGWGEVQSRINFNLGYFSTNYAIVFALLSIYSLVTNILLLFVILLVVAGMYGIGCLQGSDLNVGFTTFTTSQLYTGLMIVAIPLGFFASPISTILWLIGASAVTILGHASIMEKPIESAFAEEQV